MINYEMSELVPIVAAISKKYTTWESTSISYEKAQQFMEAVVYCLEEVEKQSEQALINKGSMPAEKAYEIGYEIVVQKVKAAQHLYNDALYYFNYYGNKNLKDTFIKGISGFFKYYDARFEPQNTIITMDYPLLRADITLKGIDAVEVYLHDICLEQSFLKEWSADYISRILATTEPDVREGYFNVCSSVLRSVISTIVVDKDKKPYEKLWKMINGSKPEELIESMNTILHQLIVFKYKGNKDLEQYLENEIADYVNIISAADSIEGLKNAVYIETE